MAPNDGSQMISIEINITLTCNYVWVELRGLEPPAPCLQIDVSAWENSADLRLWPRASDRRIPALTGGNGTLMARRTAEAVARSEGLEPPNLPIRRDLRALSRSAVCLGA